MFLQPLDVKVYLALGYADMRKAVCGGPQKLVILGNG